MELAARVERLEAEAAIRRLVAAYCFHIDDHDLDAVGALFTDDAVVRSVDGVMNASGRAAIVEQYRQRFTVLGPSNHIGHDHLIDFTGPSDATGRLSAHAELWRHERMMVTAMRYADRYRRDGGVWRFAERVIAFLYYIPVEDYAAVLGQRDRMRAYASPQPADYPEALPGWRDYRA